VDLAGGRRRRYYRLTPGGVEAGRRALEGARVRVGGLPGIRPAVVEGDA
jgi:hypothetical protein